ncbi:hypothetical protein PIB30_073377 [Stylosanthes scabra]|uniref:Uncharacterized protein n=1 Tax=Stylosanthes scabra TaxID=79078 RepID=A0ABU6RPP4_9FABA|nr:hypothetical protein [Stylosanthes scabra]
MFVKVRSLEEEFPFYIHECLLETFLLYCYLEPVQILGMNEVSGESGLVADFLDQYLCSKKPLCLNRLVKWERKKESVTKYLKKTIGGLKNFFKMKNERELSTSNAVKSEQGMVVNQPSEKKKPISVKRRRAEEGNSEKGKVIDLNSYKCCGKEVSLDEVKVFTPNQKKLHRYVGSEDLSSMWFEHFPLRVVPEEHFQSKADFDLIESVSDIGRAQFMQKRKELLELKGENVSLKGKVQGLEKDKSTLESRVVELCGQKKEAELNKENHGYDMLLVGFE